jgi:hypothetical protein
MKFGIIVNEQSPTFYLQGQGSRMLSASENFKDYGFGLPSKLRERTRTLSALQSRNQLLIP